MEKILLGMSGGIDSSAAAIVLKEMGYEVAGITLSLGKGCCAFQNASAVSKYLGIKWQVYNSDKDFRRMVIDYTINEYKRGRTPNPCAVCNKDIKFRILLKIADEMGIEKVATGHYARVKNENKRYMLMKGRDREKSQEYFLAMLTQGQLSRAFFPLGDRTKVDTKKITKDLPVQKWIESQDICFVKDGKRIGGLIENKEGDIIDEDGRLLGKHKGIFHYTIGQRRGIGISSQTPMYVLRIIPEKNTIVVGKEKALYKRRFLISRPNWIFKETPDFPIEAEAKIRYKFKPAQAIIDKNVIEFREPQKSITPGQLAVFYKGDYVLGAGWIKEIIE